MAARRAPLTGVFPIAPTTFTAGGDLDLASQQRALDFLVDAGVDGICILANYAEQFALTDAERDELTDLCLAHIAGRVPVIVTTSHFSTRIAVERSRRAEAAGAAMVMLMPPYHGATLRADETGVAEYFRQVAAAITIPVMVQDAPLSGATLSAPFLARLAQDVPNLAYFKIESAFAASKLRDLIALAGDAIDGPFDGEEGITLGADLEAGATGTMPSAMIPEVLGRVVRDYLAGRREDALALYHRHLPLINFENRQCGLRACKALMREGGIIASDATRHPTAPLHPATRAGLLSLARQMDPLILRWGR
ncbi:MAG TPA: dihydrodipicolinate synthase family protein [Thermomicrobiales bacterium]|nr:dihydrodipicolinate synthase family protein [Thermomicrobiales bacterium]